MNKNFAKPVRFNKLLAKLQPDSYFRYGGAWYFFGWWIVGNMVGTGLGITVGLINASALLKFPIDIVLWSITGVTVGFTQKLALQHWFNLKYWVWFN